MNIGCPKASQRDWDTVLKIIENADTLLNIDCVRRDTLSEQNPLLKSIQHDGVVIYRRNYANQTNR